MKDFSDRSIWHKYQNLTPEELNKEFDVVIIEGRLGVAENGAIWVDE